MRKLIPVFIFGLVIFSFVGELIGLSFEQVKFIVYRGLTVSESVYIHFLKLPAFVSIAVPFALLLATIITYSQLSRNNEILAFQSCSFSLWRIITPALVTSIIVALILFVFNELIVPTANYQTAIALEKALDIDRKILYQDNLIYPEFEENKLKFLLYAKQINPPQLKEITLLMFQDNQLQKIIIASLAQWNETQQSWSFYQVIVNPINPDKTYGESQTFQKLTLKLPKMILEFINNYRIPRELNLIECYKRLTILEKIGNDTSIRELRVNIQERYAQPLSCIIFMGIGSILGIKYISKGNSFGITIIIIFSYYMIKFLTTSLSLAGIIPIFWGVWLPNLLLGSLGVKFFVKFNY